MFSKHAVPENLVHQKNALCSFLLCPGSAAAQLKESTQRELRHHRPNEERQQQHHSAETKAWVYFPEIMSKACNEGAMGEMFALRSLSVLQGFQTVLAVEQKG